MKIESPSSHRAGLAVAVIVGLAGLAACGTTPDASGRPGASTSGSGRARIPVVATTTLLADLVLQVGGERVAVHALIPKGGDVHTFDPAPSDAARLAGAKLLVMNGLGLDDWLLGLARDAGAAAVPVVELGEGLDVAYVEGPDGHVDDGAEEDGPDGHLVNPHLWLDVDNARLYVERIAEALGAADPAGRETYAAGSAAYGQRLAALDGWIAEQLAGIAAEARRVVSFHDAFPYFARAYDLEIVGVVVEAPGQEPSAAEVARLIGTIRASGVKAILAEAQFGEQLTRTIAAETGATVVSGLYTDSLGNPPLDTYEAAMRWNTEQIVGALR